MLKMMDIVKARLKFKTDLLKHRYFFEEPDYDYLAIQDQ